MLLGCLVDFRARRVAHGLKRIMLCRRELKLPTVAALLAALALFIAPSPAGAHHSGAMFDMAHQITLSGVVTKVEWTNPHTLK